MGMLSALIESRLAELPGQLALAWPGGQAGSSTAPVRLTLHRRRPLAWLARGHIGKLGDAYVRGEMDIEGALPVVMEVAAKLVGDPVARAPSASWLNHWHSQWRHNGRRSDEDVRFHYDVCDDFYALWLDRLRVYSCAYWRGGATTLAQAQEAKLDHVCSKLKLQPGQRLLDIGCGWGALLLWAAEHHGVHGLGITLSHNQFSHVSRLIDEKSLRGRVEVRLADYRELPAGANFDAIASVGMFEHVGRANLDAYFAQLRSLLKPGGLVLNHGITAGGTHNLQLGAGMGDFIEKHIFPGGELEHVSHVSACLSNSGLELLDAENLRPHYARTLWAWSQALESQLARARELTSESTVRAYRLYLAGCAMCFERGWLSLYQLLASRPDGRLDTGPMRGAQSMYPFERSYMYR